MKRLGIIGVCAAMCFGAMAQESVIKEAKKAKTFDKMVEIITPAFSNPETANLPETYFIPGKAGVEVFKKLRDKEALDGVKPTPQESYEASKALLKGYEFLMKAVEMIPNAPKPDKKTAKEVAKLLCDTYEGFSQAGSDFYNNNEFMKAYDAWNVFISLPDNPLFADNKAMQVKAATTLNDQVKADYAYNMGICALKAEKYPEAYNALETSIRNSDDNKSAYELALSCAVQLGDKEKVDEIANIGYKKFGDSDTQFLSFIIQGLLDENNVEKAMAVVDQAISDYPNVSHYYYMKGFIVADKENYDEAIDLFKKAIALDDKNDAAYFWVGYAMMKNYDKINNDAPNEQKAYDKIKAEKLDPILRDAIPFLEQAWRIKDEKQEDLRDTENLLKSAYYNLGLDPDKELSKVRGY